MILLGAGPSTCWHLVNAFTALRFDPGVEGPDIQPYFLPLSLMLIKRTESTLIIISENIVSSLYVCTVGTLVP